MRNSSVIYLCLLVGAFLFYFFNNCVYKYILLITLFNLALIYDDRFNVKLILLKRIPAKSLKNPMLLTKYS